MALPWIIGAAVVGIAGAVAKSISDDREEEERRARRRREEEREQLEREQAEKREAEARRARELERQRREAAQKAKDMASLNHLNDLFKQYGNTYFEIESISTIRSISFEEAKNQLLDIFNKAQDDQEIKTLESKVTSLGRLKDALRG